MITLLVTISLVIYFSSVVLEKVLLIIRLMEQKALRKSQKEVQMALQDAITQLLHGKSKKQKDR